MTERVEQEYTRYIAEHKDVVSGQMVTLNVKKMAQHFYNLALNDVKAEAWRLLEESPFSATACIKLTSLVKFINNQKK